MEWIDPSNDGDQSRDDRRISCNPCCLERAFRLLRLFGLEGFVAYQVSLVKVR